MIKLSDLIKRNEQPGEETKMKNFLNRGSRDQTDLYPNKYNVVGSKPGSIEETQIETPESPLPPNGRPENRNRIVPFQWDEPDGLFEEGGENKIHQALIGREFQTLEDLKKITTRLEAAGYSPADVIKFVLAYIED